MKKEPANIKLMCGEKFNRPNRVKKMKAVAIRLKWVSY